MIYKAKKLAEQNYERFCKIEGSQYIASEFALKIILSIIKKFNVKDILEIGLGIGCISDTVLRFNEFRKKDLNYFGTEKNEFCLLSLPKNVKNYSLLNLFSDLNAIPNIKFDLIIIDGYDDKFEKIISFCKKSTIIFIEGDRKEQTNKIKNIFPNCLHVNIITLKKCQPYNHGNSPTTHYVGGGQLIFLNPTLKIKIFWFVKKTETFMKMLIRKYKLQQLNMKFIK